ncbi:uncharacterized protein [Bemisia tabaci]|uniref:uncharacterized protein n=1 Tax=Bemisia tabaci TaxID=7038 RepID=UPI003B283094
MSEKVPAIRSVRCKVCDQWYVKGKTNHERSASHLQRIFSIDAPITLVESAFQRRLETYFLKNQDETDIHLENYLNYKMKPTIITKIRETLRIRKSLKVNINVYLEYVKAEDEDQTPEDAETQIKSFKTKNIDFFRHSNLTKKLKQMVEKILAENAEFHMKESGWTLIRIIGTELRINRFNALQRAGSSYIPLPITSKHVVNVKNDDFQCFKYAVLGKHLPPSTRNKNRASKYAPYSEKYDFSCVSFPTPLKEISKFERVNNVSISIFGLDGYDDETDDDNVREDAEFNEIGFGEEDYIPAYHNGSDCDEEDVDDPPYFVRDKAVEETGKKKRKGKMKDVENQTDKPLIYPLRVTDEEKEDHIDLLYYTKGGKSHYCWISNFESLVASQMTSNEHKAFICKKCFSFYHSEEKLAEHKILCRKLSKDSFLPEYPEDPVLYFENYAKTLKHKYVVYCDFECYLRRMETDHKMDHLKPKKGTNSVVYQHHTPMSYAYMVVSPDPKINTEKPVLYRGDNAHQHFLDAMLELAQRISRRMQIEQDIRMSQESQVAFDSAVSCEMCHVQFSNAIPKVRDHDHQYVDPALSNYRMALCGPCNLKLKHSRTMIVISHNWSYYDGRLVSKAVSGQKLKVTIIPSTEETYISLMIRMEDNFAIKFVDSYRFLAASLDKLVSELPPEAFVRTEKLCETPEQLEMVKRKAVFCYDYVTDESKLQDTKPPPKEAFFNKLKNEGISDEDYHRFCETWRIFGVKDLGSYSDLYLKLDVCLLADIFEEFRSFGLKHYELDCANYLTLPSFAFDAFLKMTDVHIDLFTKEQHDMTLMILNHIRGGISQCMLRHAEANNPLVPETYDPTLPNSYLMYFDVTALYAYTMRQPLPCGSYEWVPEDELKEIDVLKMEDDAKTGLILEVDLSYPEHLHHLHSDLPFCCENKVPPRHGSKHVKLLTTLEPKNNYVIHYVALKQALEHGLEITRIHRALKFKQRPYLREFIDLNARLRQEAQGNEFHQSVLKLCSNACYGKFLENPMKRKRIVLATNAKQLSRYVSKAEFIDRTIFDEQLAAVHLHRKKVKFNRPGIVGFSILDLSKTHMYKFHYDVMLKRYPRDNVHICYMDTDSYIYRIVTPDIYADMLENLELYDTSNYPKEHPCYSAKNYKKMGTFKDESKGSPVIVFYGLGAKIYMYRSRIGLDKRAKGVQRSVLKKTIDELDYAKALYQNVDTVRKMRRIQSKKLEMYTIETKKKALSSFDDKRVVLQGNVVTLPYGHIALEARKSFAADLNDKLGTVVLKSSDPRTRTNFKANLDALERKSLEMRKTWYREEKRANLKRERDDSEGRNEGDTKRHRKV